MSAHPQPLIRRILALTLTLAMLVAGCAAPSINAAPCPHSVQTALAPPGTYVDQGVTLEYERLVPQPDPRRNVDVAYSGRVLADPVLLEQLYADATAGNQRAAWLMCEFEATARSGGEQIARYLASLRCQTIESCRANHEQLPFSRDTASGQRLLGELGAGFRSEAERLELQSELIGNTLALVVGVGIAARVSSTLPPLSVSGAGGSVLVETSAISGVRVAGPTQRFGSFTSLKRTLGTAGPDKQWHHIVEQTPGNVSRFGPAMLHSTDNVIAIETATHRAISAHYSSKLRELGGPTVRQWLSTQSFEAQWAYGIKALRDFGVIP